MAENFENIGGHRGIPWRVLGWGSAVALLLVPFVAMQFTSEVQWGAIDFLFMGGLIGGIGFAFELLARKGGYAYRIAAGLALLAMFLLVWLNGAVGIIGSENNDANLMYAGVIAVAIGGAFIAHLRPAGMARAMLAAAAAQALVAAIALAGDLGTDGLNWPRDTLGATAILATIWLASAALFFKAARDLD